MGLSFHDEDSFVEATIGSLRFAPDVNVMPEDGGIGIVDQERRDHGSGFNQMMNRIYKWIIVER